MLAVIRSSASEIGIELLHHCCQRPSHRCGFAEPLNIDAGRLVIGSKLIVNFSWILSLTKFCFLKMWIYSLACHPHRRSLRRFVASLEMMDEALLSITFVSKELLAVSCKLLIVAFCFCFFCFLSCFLFCIICFDCWFLLHCLFWHQGLIVAFWVMRKLIVAF